MNTQTLENTEKSEKIDVKPQAKITCGIIMPIATMSPEYTAEHWEDVRAIIDAAIKRANFEPRIVSDSEDSTIIHKSIINNIYHDEIIVCDVSNKNANVMFELGMRLAFNKPVVIIKDDKTGYSFDTSNIEHIGYRKDLRHNTVEKFINDLSKKIRATYEAPQKDGYQPFLSHFGKFEVAKIENKSIGESEAIERLLNRVTSIDNRILSIENNINQNIQTSTNNNFKNKNHSLAFANININDVKPIIDIIRTKIPELDFGYKFEPEFDFLEITLDKTLSKNLLLQFENEISTILNNYYNNKP